MTECTVQVLYLASRYTALDALVRRKGNYQITFADGTIISSGDATNGWAFMYKCEISSFSDSKPLTIDMTFAVPGGWTPTAGAIGNGLVTLSSGTGSLDLTATGYAGSGKSVVAISFLNPATNANTITVAHGASAGYAGLGSTFSAVLAPGQAATFYPIPTAAVIGVTNKVFDITGTGAQTLQTSVLMQ
jgi:hypothetical protein